MDTSNADAYESNMFTEVKLTKLQMVIWFD